MVTDRTTRARGFTLVELLIVIGILGLLAMVLLPNVLGARTEGEVADTRARIMFVAEAVKKFERQRGFYPPADFVDPDGVVKVKADTRNAGIESLVVFLCQKRLGMDSLADHEDWLANTDGDNTGGLEIPLLQRADKMEVVDSWGMPLVYFTDMNDGYTRKATVMTPAGDSVGVQPLRNPRTGKFAAPGKFQILSAGPDGEFGNADDVTYPEVVEE